MPLLALSALGCSEDNSSATEAEENANPSTAGTRGSNGELAAAPSAGIDSGALSGRQFALESAQGLEPVSAKISLKFDETEFSVDADCNRLLFAYEVCDDRLCAAESFRTNDICDSQHYLQDDWLASFFSTDPRLMLDEDRLTLSTNDSVLVFVDADSRR